MTRPPFERSTSGIAVPFKTIFEAIESSFQQLSNGEKRISNGAVLRKLGRSNLNLYCQNVKVSDVFVLKVKLLPSHCGETRDQTRGAR